MEEGNQSHYDVKELELAKRETAVEKVDLKGSVLEVKAASEVESYWLTKKKEFVEEMKRLLAAGIYQGEEGKVSECPSEVLNKKLAGVTAVLSDLSNSKESQNEAEKCLIKECALWIVEGKTGNDFDLIKLSGIVKDYSERHLQQAGKTVEFYRDIIAENCEKKNYGIKLTKDIISILQPDNHPQEELSIGLHEIWEVKEMQVLASNTKLEDLDYLRKNNRHHSALLRSLERLVKAIERKKGEDEAFGNYQKIASNPPIRKIQQKLLGGLKKPQRVGKFFDENLKKIKIDDGKTGSIMTFIDSSQKKQQIQSRGQSSNKKTADIEKQKEEEIVSLGVESQHLQNGIVATGDSNIKDNDQNNKNMDSSKNSIISICQTKKNGCNHTQTNSKQQNGQKNLFSFFKKQTAIEKTTPQDEPNQELANQTTQEGVLSNQLSQKQFQEQPVIPVIRSKSIFRKIGSAEPRSSILQTSERIRNIHDTVEVFEVIKEETKNQWNIMKQQRMKNLLNSQRIKGGNLKKRRRVLVIIHDYLRKYKNVIFDLKSKKINPRNPLARDEEIIQYDLDSEDELQELNAENIENDEEDPEQDDRDEGESSEQFIVPDDYLSNDGVDSERENIVGQKKVSFYNYSFTENGNQQGFIIQDKDKTPEVINFLENYQSRVFQGTNETFPLLLNKNQQIPLAEDQQQGIIGVNKNSNLNHCWTEERLKAYVLAVHEMVLPKKILLEQIAKLEIMKDVSKNRLEKKFREIVQKQVKPEYGGIKCWEVNSAVIESLELDDNEIDHLKKNRFEEYKASKYNKKEDKRQQQLQVVLPQQIKGDVFQLKDHILRNNPSQELVKGDFPIIKIFSTLSPSNRDIKISSIIDETIISSSSQAREIQKEEIKEEQNQNSILWNSSMHNNSILHEIEEDKTGNNPEDQRQIDELSTESSPNEEIKLDQRREKNQYKEKNHSNISLKNLSSEKKCSSVNEYRNKDSKKSRDGMKQTNLMDIFKRQLSDQKDAGQNL